MTWNPYKVNIYKTKIQLNVSDDHQNDVHFLYELHNFKDKNKEKEHTIIINKLNKLNLKKLKK